MIDTEDQARAFLSERCDHEALKRLQVLDGALREENAIQNLVSPSSLNELWKRHFVDSAQLFDHVPRETANLLDLGSGAGFPGLILAALRCDLEVTLVETRAKRVEWLNHAIGLLELTNCAVLGMRVEKVATREFGAITARAFAPLRKLLDIAGRFSTKDTVWVLPKGRSAAQEVEDLPPRLRRMFHVEQSQTSADAGIIVGKGKVERV
ncbi:MAG: 16S rRNA (guanine(527)-N(7))-methyltransferase RsmG [Erythrobacter sp.]|nr:16S rRNA (guanine(527)-N(7))-methyltransferase RsmG [Erythrobacter sp.]